jgi:methionine-rich copper-binding protein CopC
MSAFVKCGKWLCLLLLMSGTSQVCGAHAILMDSSPRADSAVQGSDLTIRLRFNVRIDGERSRLRLTGPGGTIQTLTPCVQPTPDTLQAHLSRLKAGAYTLGWQVLASDGHISSGAVPFRVY